ncbi:MAG: hypothetical protein CL557_12560 [Alphaproteobacteria bacterium]|nr:hypothetical protein [Alphaproteobacteria bacterium]
MTHEFQSAYLLLNNFLLGKKMTTQLDRIEWKLDQVLGALANKSNTDSPTASTSGTHGNVDTLAQLDTLPDMTSKQHASLQMLLRGADNNEIGERFNVSPNTAKVYVRSIAKKLGVTSRAQIVVRLLDLFNEVDDNAYRIMSGGLPKDWDRSYEFPDPFAKLYRVEREDDDNNIKT